MFRVSCTMTIIPNILFFLYNVLCFSYKIHYMKHKIKCLIAMFLFATYPTISKFVLEKNSPLVLTFMTEILSVAVLLFVFGFFPEIKKYLAMKKKKMIYLLAMGVFAGVLGPFLNLTGLLHSSVINLVILVSLQTPFTVLLSYFFLKEKITANYLIGVFMLVIGMCVYSTNFFQIPMQFTWNDLYFVAAALAFSIGDVLYKKKLSHISHEMVLIGRNLFGALIIFLIITLFSAEAHINVSFDSVSTIGIILIVLIPIIAAQTLWYGSLEKIKTTQAAVFDSMYAIFASIIAFVVLRESITSYQLFGGLIMVLGLIISQLHLRLHFLDGYRMKLQSFKQH